MGNKILVFGSNEAGIHGAGAARVAYQIHGARYGMGFGHYGNSFAIPTKDRTISNTLPMVTIAIYVEAFLAYARSHPDDKFQVTCIGCGLAGLTDAVVAPLFAGAPANCEFDEKWKPYLPDHWFNFWGTF